MSKDYSIIAIIELYYNPKNVLEILLRGKKLGLNYLEPNLSQYDPSLLKPISNEKTILNTLQVENFVATNIKNTFFFFHIFNKNGQIELCFNHFSYPWYKVYSPSNIEDIDIKKYTILLMDLINHWRILSFIIENK